MGVGGCVLKTTDRSQVLLAILRFVVMRAVSVGISSGAATVRGIKMHENACVRDPNVAIPDTVDSVPMTVPKIPSLLIPEIGMFASTREPCEGPK